jgi:hypothetical protein
MRIFLLDYNNLQHGIINGLTLGFSTIGQFFDVKNAIEDISCLVKKPDEQPKQQQ